MMRSSLTALVLGVCSHGVLAQGSIGPSVTTVEVFANSATVVRPPFRQPGYVLKVYRVDAMAQLEQQLNAGLPKNEADAMAYMRQHEAEIRRRYKDQITNAASGMTLAVQYRLDRLPAIVINRAKVIYGVADVDRAIELFAAAQQRPSR